MRRQWPSATFTTKNLIAEKDRSTPAVPIVNNRSSLCALEKTGNLSFLSADVANSTILSCKWGAVGMRLMMRHSISKSPCGAFSIEATCTSSSALSSEFVYRTTCSWARWLMSENLFSMFSIIRFLYFSQIANCCDFAVSGSGFTIYRHNVVCDISDSNI